MTVTGEAVMESGLDHETVLPSGSATHRRLHMAYGKTMDSPTPPIAGRRSISPGVTSLRRDKEALRRPGPQEAR